MKTFAQALLDWFDREARVLPWRLPASDGSGLRRDPYAVLVSEFMLQQTQVVTVIPYYQAFMARFPDLQSLAAAQEAEVLKLWEGLGYYRRARQLHRLAEVLVEEYGGRLPRDRKTLLTLPGIGPYSAGALLAFAYDLPEAAVDGNVVRVFARLEAQAYVQGDLGAQRAVRDRLADLIPDQRPGDFSEALIELGATLCVRTGPACGDCPLAPFCRALAQDRVMDFPLKAKAKAKPVSQLTYLLIHDGETAYGRLRSAGLLSGLYEFFPLVGKLGEAQKKQVEEALAQTGLAVRPRHLTFVGEHRAVFSHRIWDMAFWELALTRTAGLEGQDWQVLDLDLLARLPLPVFLASWREDFLARIRGQKKSPQGST